MKERSQTHVPLKGSKAEKCLKFRCFSLSSIDQAGCLILETASAIMDGVINRYLIIGLSLCFGTFICVLFNAFLHFVTSSYDPLVVFVWCFDVLRRIDITCGACGLGFWKISQ